MVENIAVPAESLRQMARSVSDEVDKERRNGRKANARALERSLEEVYGAIQGSDGEFVSVNPETVSDLAAFSDIDRYNECATHFLEQYDWW